MIDNVIAKLENKHQKKFLEIISNSVKLSNIQPLLPYIRKFASLKAKKNICASFFPTNSQLGSCTEEEKEIIAEVLGILKSIKDDNFKCGIYRHYFDYDNADLDIMQTILNDIQSYEDTEVQAEFYGHFCNKTLEHTNSTALVQLRQSISLEQRHAMAACTIQAAQNPSRFIQDFLNSRAFHACLLYLEHPQALSIFGNGEGELNILEAMSTLTACPLRSNTFSLFFQHPGLKHDNAVTEACVANLLQNTADPELAIFCTGHMLSNDGLQEDEALVLLNTALKKYKDILPEQRVYLSVQLLKREIISPALIHQEAEIVLKSIAEIKTSLATTFLTSCIKHLDTSNETLTLVQEQAPRMQPHLRVSIKYANLERLDCSNEAASTFCIHTEGGLTRLLRTPLEERADHLRNNFNFFMVSLYNLCISYLKRENVDQTIINKILGHTCEQNTPVLSRPRRYNLYKAYIESPHANPDEVAAWIDANPDSELAKNSRNRKKKRVARPQESSSEGADSRDEPAAKKQKTE